MTDTTAATATIDRMFAAWNATDPRGVRAHLDAVLSAHVHFADPSIDLNGIDDFEANVHHVHEQIPGAVYSRTSDVDAHHGHHRYHWAIHLDGRLLLAGFDVTRIDQAGRIEQVVGFFGRLDAGDRSISEPAGRRVASASEPARSGGSERP